MADAKTAFDTSDSVKLKGNVSGVTRLSKNAKALMFLGAFLLMCFILFSIFSMGGDEPAQLGDQHLATLFERGAALDVAESVAYLRAEADQALRQD